MKRKLMVPVSASGKMVMPITLAVPGTSIFSPDRNATLKEYVNFMDTVALEESIDFEDKDEIVSQDKEDVGERVESAIVYGMFVFPEGKIVINLVPSDLKKSGSYSDLPITVGLLVETGQMIVKRKEELAYF